MADNVVSLLSTCITRVVDPASLPDYLADQDPYDAFLVQLNGLGNGTEKHIVADVFAEIHMSVRALADGCCTAVQQYWKASDLFVSALNSLPSNGPAFNTAVDAFVALGQQMKSIDPNSSLMLFMDFSLEKMKDTLTKNQNKRLGIMRVMNAFMPDSTQAKVKGAKKLQMLISDLGIFINCLMILATNQETTDVLLLDLYHYYVTIGLGMHSPKIRACAISLATLLVPDGLKSILPLKDQLVSLGRTEKWWEVKAQLLVLAGSIVSAYVNANQKSGSNSDNHGPETWRRLLYQERMRRVDDVVAPRAVVDRGAAERSTPPA